MDLTDEILSFLSNNDFLITSDQFPSAPPVSVKSSVDKLKSRDMIDYETLDREEAILTPEGQATLKDGSHEARVFEAVREAVGGLKITDLPKKVGKESAKIGQGKAFKEGWIGKTNDGLLQTKVEAITDLTRDQLRAVEETKTHNDAKVLADLKRRKLVSSQKVLNYKLRKGPKYSRELVKEETDLTAEMIASGSWRNLSFKSYNFKALGASTSAGALHPLNKVRHEFRQIFFEMGFEEMPTNRYYPRFIPVSFADLHSSFVETGFWNFDALFVPQQHPARDLQDTFYISDPQVAGKPQPDLVRSEAWDKTLESSSGLDYDEYFENVRKVHQEGNFGSIGYRYPWKEDESLRLVLRTHTTAISAYMLHKLAENPRPARFFSIDRVFRNETVDATHLAEFHQVEGVIADFGLALGGLVGFMETFFAKMGVHGLRFKPAYNPYTEPSLEIFGYHAGLKKWVEIGNSGMFRPEMLVSMGLPKDLRVYGWGLSLERPTMIRYGISNIRELLGHKVDIGLIETNAATRL